MDYDVRGIQEVAMFNKNKLKRKTIKIPIPGEGIDYRFNISGVGSSFIKIEKFFYYSEISKAISEGNKYGFEFSIAQLISDSDNEKNVVMDSSSELKKMALDNKSKLKNQFVNIFIGYKEYGFKIAGIGAKSIKIEMYVGYDEIARELSSGNDISLEYILLEVIMGNTVDYSKFNQYFDEDELSFIDDEDVEEVPIDVDLDNIQKLTDDEFDEKYNMLRGWQKLVLDSIEDIIDDVFTLNDLLSQNRILSYKTSDEDLKTKVIENLNQLIDIGLISKVNKSTYVKLW